MENSVVGINNESVTQEKQGDSPATANVEPATNQETVANDELMELLTFVCQLEHNEYLLRILSRLVNVQQLT